MLVDSIGVQMGFIACIGFVLYWFWFSFSCALSLLSW